MISLISKECRSPSELVARGSGGVRSNPATPRLREVVVRVRHLERLVGEVAQQIAELIAEVGDDLVALRLDVCAGSLLVLNGRAGRTRRDRRTAELRLVEVGRYEPTGGLVNRPSVKPPWPVLIAVGVG